MTALPRAEWLRIMNGDRVKLALLKRANKIAAKARTTAASEKVDTTITVTQGVRPQGRPYARVSSSNAAAEHGNSWTKRSRVLGRSTYQNGPST
jgi:hypothetical protein